MKVIVKTDEYTIFQKRSERYAVQNADKAWVNGDAKIIILLEHKLIEAAVPKPPVVEEVVVEEAVVEEAVVEEVVVEEAVVEEVVVEEAVVEEVVEEEAAVDDPAA
ncbi:MAG: hypothetical protein O6766_12405 [Gammaproteobacteria bacterium]|nr:hypothetical protein [Gammaproteobacteria bacterium]